MDEAIIKGVIKKVNSTLSYFDPGFTSARRLDDLKERCYTFDKYVECRFNYEFSKLEEWKPLFEALDGRVFTCTLTEPNLVKRNFKLATITIQIDEMLFEDPETLNNELNKLRDWLGGNTIKFTHKKIKFTYKIENEENCK